MSIRLTIVPLLIFSLLFPYPLIATPARSTPNLSVADLTDRLFEKMESEGISLLDASNRPVRNRLELSRLGNSFFIRTAATEGFPHSVTVQVRSHHSIPESTFQYTLVARDTASNRVLGRTVVGMNYQIERPENIARRLKETATSFGSRIELAYSQASATPSTLKRVSSALKQLFGVPSAHAEISERRIGAFIMAACALALPIATIYLCVLESVPNKYKPILTGFTVVAGILLPALLSELLLEYF